MGASRQARDPQSYLDRSGWGVSIAVGIAALILYLFIAPRVDGDGDASEMTLALAVKGVAHPPGYPLYILAGHFFATLLHELRASWGYAANAWSAAGAGVALMLFHRLAQRVAPDQRLSAVWRLALPLTATVMLALNPIWLTAATHAEVYSWHVAWFCGAVLVTDGLIQRFEQHPTSTGLARAFFFWGLACGLGLAHHLTSVFFILPLIAGVFSVLSTSTAWRWRQLAMAGLGAALPLLAYAFVAYRAFNPAPFQWPLLEPSMASVIHHVTGGAYGRLIGSFRPTDLQRAQLATSVYPLLIVGLLVLLVMAWQRRRRNGRPLLLALLGGAALQLLFVARYGVGDPASHFLPVLAIALLAIPIGGAPLVQRAPHPMVLAPVAVGVMVAGVLWVRAAQETTRQSHRTESVVRAAWESLPERPAFVIWHNDFYTRLKSYQLLRGERSAIHIVNPSMLTWPYPRNVFRATHGFDALDGLALRDTRDLARIPGNIQRQTELAVIDFDMALRRVLQSGGR